MPRKYNSARINVAKNGFVIFFTESGGYDENVFVAHTLNDVADVLNEKLDMGSQE